ncbi:MAG: tryptophan-rich sensory protein [Candidatus Protochlamydia sp.]|nr:tryptophan-rich sensory protein [Candidatus Protochlamydia sp.]
MHLKFGSFTSKLLLCIFFCLGGGWLTGLITQYGVKKWYPHLIKPYGTPPDITFPIVWTILYISMAISLALLWDSNRNAKSKGKAFLFFGVQLGLNFIWSWLFFYLQRPGLALLDIICLWTTLLLTIIYLWEQTRLGSLLLFPYLLWVTYAAYLNLFIGFIIECFPKCKKLLQTTLQKLFVP